MSGNRIDIRNLQVNLAKYGFVILLIVLLAVFLANSTFITLQPGEKGVLFQKFSGGLDKDNVYDQGFRVVMPWNRMIIYDVREQIREETMDVLSSNGLPITVDVSARFRPIANQIGYLHDEIGTEYADVIVKDVVRSAAREVIGQFTPEELYSVKRDEVKLGIEEIVAERLAEKYVMLEAVNLRSIALPETIENAIQTKLVQEQEKEQYDFKIDKERKEAERKGIEAEGIRNFQEIVSQGISQEYLRWKGIEATENLAKSENAKMVIIGSAKDGLPIILGD